MFVYLFVLIFVVVVSLLRIIFFLNASRIIKSNMSSDLKFMSCPKRAKLSFRVTDKAFAHSGRCHIVFGSNKEMVGNMFK